MDPPDWLPLPKRRAAPALLRPRRAAATQPSLRFECSSDGPPLSEDDDEKASVLVPMVDGVVELEVPGCLGRSASTEDRGSEHTVGRDIHEAIVHLEAEIDSVTGTERRRPPDPTVQVKPTRRELRVEALLDVVTVGIERV